MGGWGGWPKADTKPQWETDMSSDPDMKEKTTVAIKKASTATAAPATKSANVASFNPDNMASAGLKDDFDGTIVKARLVPWDYNGKLDHHVLGVAITIQPDEEDQPFTQTYSAGDLESFVPSMDGVNPVDLENGEGEALEGVFAMRVGKKEQLNNNSNFAQFMTALIDAGFDKDKLDADLRFLEGTYGHWNRIAQKKRSGIVRPDEAAGEQKRNSDLLVITELKESAAPATKKPAASAPKAASAPAATSDDLDETLRTIVEEAVIAAGEDGIQKGKLGGVAMKKLPANIKAKGVKRIQEKDFLEAEDAPWLYDPETGILFPNV